MAQSSSSSGGGGQVSEAQQQLKDFWDTEMTGIKSLTTVRKLK